MTTLQYTIRINRNNTRKPLLRKHSNGFNRFTVCVKILKISLELIELMMNYAESIIENKLIKK
ncbi:hypothetical protein ACI3P7_11980, partial [Glaesserella parasuis]